MVFEIVEEVFSVDGVFFFSLQPFVESGFGGCGNSGRGFRHRAICGDILAFRLFSGSFVMTTSTAGG